MSEAVRVSRLGRTIAAATVAAIIFIPSGFLLVLILNGFAALAFGYTCALLFTGACIGVSIAWGFTS